MKISAIPEKRVFLSIISEYNLKRSICELVDNAIDFWIKTQKGNDLLIKIGLDPIQQTISIEDNSGGVEEFKLDHLVSPGKTSNEIHDNVIGFFGVGSKRAVIALAQDITIYTRFKNNKAFSLHFDEYWITEDPSWDLEYIESRKRISSGTTLIELSRLRTYVTEEEIAELVMHLSEVYARFIDDGVVISVNKKQLTAIRFDNEWSYPPDYSPKTLCWKMDMDDREVDVEVTSGLINYPGDPDNSYGVFIYCNNRMITRGLNDFSVGFISGLVGNPHYNISLARTIIHIKGQSRDMPWDSSKSGIDPKHVVFKAIRQRIIDITKSYAQISRSLQGKWDQEVFPFKRGKVKLEQLEDMTSIPKSYLPTPPASKQKWHEKISDTNRKLVKQKPWAGGLLDSIIAADLISKSSLVQKNRVCLIILDSTLEIAYKEYLVNEKNIGRTLFSNIVEDRTAVQREVMKTITVSTTDLKKINHFYKLRCDLIHQKATPNINDSQIEDYRGIVVDLLTLMFGLDLA